MIVTEEIAVAAAPSCAEWAQPSPCRCSTRCCPPSRRSRSRRRGRARRFGAVFVPNGAIMEQWTPAANGGGFDVLADSEAARALPRLARRRLQPDASGHARRRPCRQRGRMADRRRRQAHRGRGRPGRHDHRPDGRPPDRAGHAVPVDRAGDRGLHRLRRRLHDRLQLRLHEHHLLELADHAAADGDQPARGVRAAVRRAWHAPNSAPRARARDRSILDFVAGEAQALQQPARLARSLSA